MKREERLQRLHQVRNYIRAEASNTYAHSFDTAEQLKVKRDFALDASLNVIAIQETLAENERLEKANAGLRSFLGVMVAEMELFLEGGLPNQSILASGSILRWKTFIEEACRSTGEGGDKPNG